ncbi:DUF418 domain-containing protein [Alkalihalobacillus pseudalcaliphilus]|uniref:DUF418 domain-containing protein n=1 Tax=Alkalihalobacillus pseudalcaliphilus TaxID=79884 RepID=UPI00064D8CC1|nr:DUF418 domain-containing protein [Alkalihalobacillus pseudalcaliphilus]KMK76823.1 hypothetical protein AB990_07915 [Alkalihalobacillus pseudalcaliphilus]
MGENKRIRLLDVLRGFAIIGTLGTNIWLFAQPGNIMSVLLTTDWWYRLDSILVALQSVFVNGKFLGLLTIMFGIGLELKYRKAERDGLPWIPLYLWTMLLLLLDGLLHFIFVFEYDILMSYAITGMIVAFLVRCRENTMNRWMKITLSIHILGILLFSVVWAMLIQDETFMLDFVRMFQETSHLYTEGTYWEQLQFRVRDFWSLRSEAILIIFMNIGLYIIGIRLFRAGAFADDAHGQQIRKKLMIYGLGIGIPLNLLILIPGGYFDIASRYVFAPILSLGYIGLFAWILKKGVLKWLMVRFELIGKAALSCYVLQNLIASIFFYGWGFGLAPISSVYLVFLAWIMITVLMMIAAHFFVKAWGTGPLELIWRKSSYGLFRKKKAQSSTN